MRVNLKKSLYLAVIASTGLALFFVSTPIVSAAATTGPVIRDIKMNGDDPYGGTGPFVAFNWKTDEKAIGKLDYGTAPGAYSQSA